MNISLSDANANAIEEAMNGFKELTVFKGIVGLPLRGSFSSKDSSLGS